MRRLFILLIGCAWTAAALGQDLVLTTSCEGGFRRLIHMAQSGRFGADVTNANVGIGDNQVRVELVRAGASSKRLVLTRKRSHEMNCRYFDIALGDGATVSDAEQLGRALDEIFPADPYEVIGLEDSSTVDRLPNVAEAWAYDGWRGVLQSFESRMMVLATLRYTVGVIAVLSIGLVATLVLLWGSDPVREPPRRP